MLFWKQREWISSAFLDRVIFELHLEGSRYKWNVITRELQVVIGDSPDRERSLGESRK